MTGRYVAAPHGDIIFTFVCNIFYLQDEGGAAASILSSLSSLVLILQLIMNISNSNNQRKNENNNNNNQNNNNNVNERVNVLLNEYENMVTAMGMSPGRSLFTNDDFEVKIDSVIFKTFIPHLFQDLEEYWTTWREDISDDTTSIDKDLLVPRLYFQAFKEVLVQRFLKTEKL